MKAILYILAVVFLVILLGVGPLLTILSLNALFNLGIAFTFWNYLAASWLTSLVVGFSSTFTRKD